LDWSNIQFAIKNDKVYIIEANPRASRNGTIYLQSIPGTLCNYAVKVMLGEKKVTDFEFKPYKKGYAIKEPVFSFHKFPNVNKELGPEMKSTGEAIYFHRWSDGWLLPENFMRSETSIWVDNLKS